MVYTLIIVFSAVLLALLTPHEGMEKGHGENTEAIDYHVSNSNWNAERGSPDRFGAAPP